ncbi:hypothetical protein ACXHPE_17965, partial [Vibrio cincinnatiensis]
GTFGSGEHLRLRLASLSAVVRVACPLMRRYALLNFSKINIQILIGKLGLFLAVFHPKQLILLIYYSFWWRLKVDRCLGL